MMIFIGTLFCNLLEDAMSLHLQPRRFPSSWQPTPDMARLWVMRCFITATFELYKEGAEGGKRYRIFIGTLNCVAPSIGTDRPVSYTHLTLPTILRV